eukprot:2310084-Pleurochrysis_carterae.AAC.2
MPLRLRPSPEPGVSDAAGLPFRPFLPAFSARAGRGDVVGGPLNGEISTRKSFFERSERG